MCVQYVPTRTLIQAVLTSIERCTYERVHSCPGSCSSGPGLKILQYIKDVVKLVSILIDKLYTSLYIANQIHIFRYFLCADFIFSFFN